MSHRSLRLLTAVVGALLVLAVLTVNAKADKAYNPTCGQSSGKYATANSLTHNNGIWDATWYQNCGTGGTVEREIQVSTDGGAHWTDENDNVFTTPGSDANRLVQEGISTGLFGCSNLKAYRLHIWDDDSDDTAPLSGGC